MIDENFARLRTHRGNIQRYRHLLETSLTDFEREIARFIVTNLNLEVAPEQIAPLDPLYGDGLGLDSIDVLEIALAVS